MISARFPPVSRWIRIAVTKKLTSTRSIRFVMPIRAFRSGIPRFCSSKTFWNSGPMGSGISCPTNWMAPVNECPARSERANISRASGKYMMNFFMRRFFLVFTTIVGTTKRKAPKRTAIRKGQCRKAPTSRANPKRRQEMRMNVPTFLSICACLRRLSICTATLRFARILFSAGTSLSSSLLRTSGRSACSRLRSSRRESRFLISFLSVHPGATRKYRDRSTARMPTNRIALIQSIVRSLLLLPVCENLGFEMDSRGVDDVEELRPHPGGVELTLYLSLIGQPLLLVHEDVLHDQDIPFHPGDFGYLDDLARPVAQPRHLDHDVQGGAHLFPDRPCGKVISRHQDHRLEARQGVTRGIRVDGRYGAVVPRVHRLQHVQRLASPNLPDDDPVGPHPKGIPDEIPLRHGSLPFDIGGAGLEPHDVLLLEDQLRRILDGDDPFRVGYGSGKDVEQRRFPRARSPRHQDVQAGLDHRAEGACHFPGQRLVLDEVFHLQGRDAEPADGNRRAVQRKRGNDHVYARPVRKPCVHQRGGFVDAPAHFRHDSLDDAHQMV